MKQLRIVGFLCLSLFMQIHAVQALGQESSESSGSMSYGVHIGITGSKFSDEQPHRSTVLDYAGGVHGKYSFSDVFSARFELNYLEHGGGLLRITTPDQLNTFDAFEVKTEDLKVSIRSLEIPVMAAYTLSVGSSRVNFLLGPSVEWVMHAGAKIQTTAKYPGSPGVFITYDDEENITKNISRFIYNATGGIGFEFPFTQGTNLNIDFRYRYSINTVYNGYSYLGTMVTGSNLRQHSVSCTVGIDF